MLKIIREMLDEDGIQGNVAKLGFFRGDFAKEINRIFPDRTLYLLILSKDFLLKAERVISPIQVNKLLWRKCYIWRWLK